VAHPEPSVESEGQQRSLARVLIEAIVIHPVTTAMITVAILLFGLVAATRMPVDLLPDLSYPSITIRTEFDDAAPAEVEELVTLPIEELVGAVPGVEDVESVSKEGTSEVMLNFAWGTKIDVAMADVREKLDRVRLPQAVQNPIVLRYDPAQEPIIRLALTIDATLAHGTNLRDVADRQIKRVLEAVRGVAGVQLHGGDEDEIRVELDADRLAALNLDPRDVVEAIKADNINQPGGALTEQQNRYLIRTVHEAKTAQELAKLIVRSSAGAELRLDDIASVERSPKEREERVLVDGREAIELSVFREADANTVAVSMALLSRIEDLQLPEGHRLVVLSNQSRFIEAAIKEVAINTLLGGFLAVAVLLFFLRNLRSTMVIALAIPISVTATFVPLRLGDVSLNLMSLGGLALGIGMLVDNSIVTLEAIARVREQHPGASRRWTAMAGTAEIAGSVVASTLTTVAVFLPMAFVEGVAGQLVRDLSLAVSLSILSSMVVSLTVVPVLEALGGSTETSSEDRVTDPPPFSPLAWLVVLPALLFWPLRRLYPLLARLLRLLALPATRAYEALESLYPGVLQVALRLRVLVLIAAFALCGLTLTLGAELGRTLLPEIRQGEFFVQVTMPQGTALERSTSVTRSMMATLASDPRIKTRFARIGSITQGGSATGQISGTHLAQLNIQLDPNVVGENDLATVEQEIFETLRSAVPDKEISLLLGRPELFSFEAPISVEIFADETDDAAQHARRVLPYLQKVSALNDVVADDLTGRPEVRVLFDRERLSRLGVGVDQAANAVQRAIQGDIAGLLHAADKQLDIRVVLPQVDRAKVSDIGRVQVGLRNGIPIPLTAVAELESAHGPAEIRRINGRRGLRIRARLAGNDLGGVAGQVENALEAAHKELGPEEQLRQGVQSHLGGQAQEMGTSLKSLAYTALLSIFLVYVVMASSFESLHHPLLIMGTVPLAIVGVIGACALTFTPISAMVGIGAIILGGIVVNNAIVLVNAVNQGRGRGLGVTTALLEAGKLRIRPILMTMATSVLGLLPMALGLGEGSALRRPLAIAVIGGLVVATILTLVVIPCAYALFPGRRRDAWAKDSR